MSSVTVATRQISSRTSISGPRGPRPSSTRLPPPPTPSRESTLALTFNHFFTQTSSESLLDDADPTPSTPFPPSDPILHSFDERLSPQLYQADTQLPTDYEASTPVPCTAMSSSIEDSHHFHNGHDIQVAVPSTAPKHRAQRPPSEPIRPSQLSFIPTSDDDDDDDLSSVHRPPASAPVGRGFRNVTFVPSRSSSPELGPIPETPLPDVYQARRPPSKTNNTPVSPAPARGFNRPSTPPSLSPAIQPFKEVLLPEVSLGGSLFEALGLDSSSTQDMPLDHETHIDPTFDAHRASSTFPKDLKMPIAAKNTPEKPSLILHDEAEVDPPVLSPPYATVPDTPASAHSDCSSCRSLRDYASDNGAGGERLLGSADEKEDDQDDQFSDFAPGTPASVHQELPGSVPVRPRQLSEYRSKPRDEDDDIESEEEDGEDGEGGQKSLSASVVEAPTSPGWHASSSSSSSAGEPSPVDVSPIITQKPQVLVAEEGRVRVDALRVVVEDEGPEGVDEDGGLASPNLTPLTSPYSDGDGASISALDINAAPTPEPHALVAQGLSSSPVEDVSFSLELADDANVSEASEALASPFSEAGYAGAVQAAPAIEPSPLQAEDEDMVIVSRASTPSTHTSTESDSTEDGWTSPSAPIPPSTTAAASEPSTAPQIATAPVQDYAAPPPGSPPRSPALLPSAPAPSTTTTPNPNITSSTLRDLSPLDRALLLLDSDYQITDDDILPAYMLYPNRQIGERTVDRGPRRAYQQVRPPPSYDSLPPRPKMKKPKVKKEGSGLRNHLRAVFGRNASGGERERERPASMVDIREGVQTDQAVPPWVGRPASVAGGETGPTRGGLLRRIVTNASASTSNVSVVNENAVRRAEAEAETNGGRSAGETASRRTSVASSTRSGISANGSGEAGGSGSGNGNGHEHEHGSIEEGASCPFPAAVPVEGRPFLRDGQTLIYPEGVACPICHNTGYANFDPRHPCLICWKKFSRPFTKLLAKFFDSEDVSESDRGRLQRPLPEMPQSAPPTVGGARTSIADER
ncbi:hypothetical protein OF83DRAFT_1177787 [Amylostereum chailletii]|nr:hypothetical protein OF83DRAFT_1177787 [Amylostereum chailletii]